MRFPGALAFAGCLPCLLWLTGCQQIEARRSIQTGERAYVAQDYDQAVGAFERGVTIAPGLEVGWWNLAMAHLALFAPGLETPANVAHAEGAITALERYLEIEPEDERARDQLLATYVNSGQYEGAIDFYERRLATVPDDLNAVAQIAEIRAMARQFDESFEWYRKRIALEPSSEGKAEAYYDMGRIVFGRLNAHPEIAGTERARIADEGIWALGEAVKLRPEHEPSVRFLALVLRERALAEGASWAQAIDIAHAETFRKRAEELLAKERARLEAEAAAADERPSGAKGGE